MALVYEAEYIKYFKGMCESSKERENTSSSFRIVQEFVYIVYINIVLIWKYENGGGKTGFLLKAFNFSLLKIGSRSENRN